MTKQEILQHNNRVLGDRGIILNNLNKSSSKFTKYFEIKDEYIIKGIVNDMFMPPCIYARDGGSNEYRLRYVFSNEEHIWYKKLIYLNEIKKKLIPLDEVETTEHRVEQLKEENERLKKIIKELTEELTDLLNKEDDYGD